MTVAMKWLLMFVLLYDIHWFVTNFEVLVNNNCYLAVAALLLDDGFLAVLPACITSYRSGIKHMPAIYGVCVDGFIVLSHCYNALKC